MITLVIANTQPVICAGIHSILKEVDGIHIAGYAENSSEIQSLVTQLRPRILLMDLTIPGALPVEIANWVKTDFPETLLLIFSAYDKDVYLAAMMDAGAVGFLSIQISAEDLITAIRRADKGELLFDKTQIRRFEEWQYAAGKKWSQMRKRQKWVIQLLANGFNKEEVAKRLGLSVRGMEFHLDTIKKILKVKSTLECVNWYHKYFPENLGAIVT